MAADPSFAGDTAAALDAALVRTEDLRVRAGRLEILKGISLDARRGEILSIIGPAGAGKSTYLRCLNRMAELDQEIRIEGKVLLGGESIYGPGVDVALIRRQVATVFSVPIPLPMTIHENLTFGLRLQSGPRDSNEERVEAALRAAY